MNLFGTNNIETVKAFQWLFGISLSSVVFRDAKPYSLAHSSVVLHNKIEKFSQKFSLRAELAKALD